jgi:hypothetical protein
MKISARLRSRRRATYHPSALFIHLPISEVRAVLALSAQVRDGVCWSGYTPVSKAWAGGERS